MRPKFTGIRQLNGTAMSLQHSRLIAERGALLDRTVAWFQKQADVLGVFLSGSLASGTADAWADIDLRVLATDDGCARLLAGRLQWPEAWGELLINEWVPGVDCCVSHFEPFLKLDVLYYSARTLQPSPWLKQPVKIFQDRTGRIAEVLQQSRALTAAPWDAAEVSRILSKALATLHECVRRVPRGELMVAQVMLGQLREYLMQLDEALRHQPSWEVSMGQREQRLSAALHSALTGSYVGLDAVAVREAARSLAGVLREHVGQLHRGYVLGRSEAADLRAVDIVRDEAIGEIPRGRSLPS